MATEEVGAVDVDEFVIDKVPACDSLPEWRPSQEADFTEAELIGLMDQAFPILGTGSGLQSAGIGNVNRVGLEFVDPPTDELQQLLTTVKGDDAARERFLELLDQLGPDDPRTNLYRRKLATALY